jgi:hypothetical protein
VVLFRSPRAAHKGGEGRGFALVTAWDGGAASPVGLLVGSRLGLLGPAVCPGEARPLPCEAKHRGGGGGGDTPLLLLFPSKNEAQKNAQKNPDGA